MDKCLPWTLGRKKSEDYADNNTDSVAGRNGEIVTCKLAKGYYSAKHFVSHPAIIFSDNSKCKCRCYMYLYTHTD